MPQQKGRCNMNATPRPWHNKSKNFGYGPLQVCGPQHSDGGDYAPICTANTDANAALIVRAVNCHDEAKAALESLINNNGTGAMEWAIVNAQAVLSQMEGGQ